MYHVPLAARGTRRACLRGLQYLLTERSIFSENHDYKRFFRVAVNTYVPIFRGLDARGGRKLRTDTHTHTHTNTRDNYSNPRCAHARRGLTSTVTLASMRV